MEPVFHPRRNDAVPARGNIFKFSCPSFGLREQPQDLIGSQREDTEHQMAHHLGMAAHADHAPAKLVFQTRIHPLHGGPFVVAHLFGRAIDVTFDNRLGGAQRAALAMRRGGVGWYPRSEFIHLDSGPTRSWELDGGNFDRLLTGGFSSQDLLGPPRPGHIPTFREILARSHAQARQEFLLRRR